MSYATPNEKPDPRTDRPTPEETPLTEAHLFGARGGDCVTEVKAVVRANFARRLERENTALRTHAERLAVAAELLKQAQFAIDLMRPIAATSLTHEAYSNIRVLREEIEDCLTALTLYRAENPKV